MVSLRAERSGRPPIGSSGSTPAPRVAKKALRLEFKVEAREA